MANNLVVQYAQGMNTVLNGVVALRIREADGSCSYWIPEGETVDYGIFGNLIGHVDRQKKDYFDNTKRYVPSTTGRSWLYNIDKIERIRTDHRDGSFKYWVRCDLKGP